MKKVPQYGLNLIVELQDVVTAYTNIGNVSQYRDAVKQGIPLHPAPTKLPIGWRRKCLPSSI